MRLARALHLAPHPALIERLPQSRFSNRLEPRERKTQYKWHEFPRYGIDKKTGLRCGFFEIYRVLVLFAGDDRPDDGLAAFLVERARLAADGKGEGLCVEIAELDILRGSGDGSQEDMLEPRTADGLRELCRDRQFDMCFAGVVCSSYSVLRFHDNCGPGCQPLRDRENVLGLPGLEPWQQQELNIGNALTRLSLECCALVYSGGGEAMIENPPDYASKERLHRPFAKEQWRHCPLWCIPAVADFLRSACNSHLVEFDQCALSSEYKKVGSVSHCQ